MNGTALQTTFKIRDYDLAATLNSGQSFRWTWRNDGWESVVSRTFVRLRQVSDGIHAETVVSMHDWKWLADYLQTNVHLPDVIATFPSDDPMRRAATACKGLRLLRQDPWECLASFILSSTKQIVQIRDIVARLCRRFGTPVPAPPNHEEAHAFPHFSRLASASESELRECKMGFRAPYLKHTAERLARGEVDLAQLHAMPVEAARAQLLSLPGVGRKIADCVLLFAYGFQEAFPVDVWIARALQQLYFPRRQVSPKRLLQFSRSHFGPNAGYAQQYLFHYMRVQAPKVPRIIRVRAAAKDHGGARRGVTPLSPLRA